MLLLSISLRGEQIDWPELIVLCRKILELSGLMLYHFLSYAYGVAQKSKCFLWLILVCNKPLAGICLEVPLIVCYDWEISQDNSNLYIWVGPYCWAADFISLVLDCFHFQWFCQTPCQHLPDSQPTLIRSQCIPVDKKVCILVSFFIVYMLEDLKIPDMWSSQEEGKGLFWKVDVF